jgi:hypothetical protein
MLGPQEEERGFLWKHLNIADPLSNKNNLGRSVSRGNACRKLPSRILPDCCCHLRARGCSSLLLGMPASHGDSVLLCRYSARNVSWVALFEGCPRRLFGVPWHNPDIFQVHCVDAGWQQARCGRHLHHSGRHRASRHKHPECKIHRLFPFPAVQRHTVDCFTIIWWVNLVPLPCRAVSQPCVTQRHFCFPTLLPMHNSLVKNLPLHGFVRAWVCACMGLFVATAGLAPRTDDAWLGIVLDGDTLMLSDEDDLEKDPSSREGGNTSLNTALNAIRESLALNFSSLLARFGNARCFTHLV